MIFPIYLQLAEVPFHIKTTVGPTSQLETKNVITSDDLSKVSKRLFFHNNKLTFCLTFIEKV